MLIKNAKRLAWEWVECYAQDRRILGAYLCGSVIDMEERATLPWTCDVDIHLVIDGEEPSEKPGKLLYKDVLLEVSFIQKGSLFPAEKLLAAYEIVGALPENMPDTPLTAARHRAGVCSDSILSPEVEFVNRSGEKRAQPAVGVKSVRHTVRPPVQTGPPLVSYG